MSRRPLQTVQVCLALASSGCVTGSVAPTATPSPAASSAPPARATAAPLLTAAAASTLEARAKAAEQDGTARRVGLYFAVVGDPTGSAARHRPDAAFPAASVIKLPILLALERAYSEGTLSRTDARDADARAMITSSSNPAANRLIDALGVRRVNQEIARRLGPEEAKGNRLHGAVTAAGRENRCTPEGIGGLLAAVASEETAGDPTAVLALKRLRDTASNRRTRIPAGTPRAQRALVGNKTGTLKDVVNDVAILEVSDGRRLVLCILMEGCPSQRRAEQFCRDLTAAAWKAVATNGNTQHPPSTFR